MKVTGLDHVVFRVADVERSLAFYVDTLGLAPVRVEEWRAGTVLFPSARVDAHTIIDIFPRGATSRYHGDLTRTVVVGTPSDEVRRMHETCVEALDAAIAQLADGANGRDVHHTVCRRLVECGFGTVTPGFEGPADGPRMIHSTGHGVGLEVHEGPQLRDLDYPLRAGDVVTVEPGLYQAGLGGVRVEDTGMVIAGGFRNFTTLPRSLDPADYL